MSSRPPVPNTAGRDARLAIAGDISSSYLDHNASAPMPEAVRRAVWDAMLLLPGNAHSPHSYGRAAAAAVAEARDQVAKLAGRPAVQVRFTSGATEANAWALSTAGEGDSVAREVRMPAQSRSGPKRVLASAVEHPSVLAWATDLVPVDGSGVLRLDALAGMLTELHGQVAMVSVMAANNETGVLQPMSEVAELCAAAGVPVHCDASQLGGRLALDLPKDCMVTISGHKLGAPKGIGALVCPVAPPPLLRGGPQERGARAGTLAVPLIVGLGAAAALCPASQLTLEHSDQRERLELACQDLGGVILGSAAERLPNTSMVLFEEPGDLIVMALDLEGIAASTGSACASGAAEHSHVLAAMGLTGIAVRFSLGPTSVVGPAVAALRRVLGRIRSLNLDLS